MKRYMRKFLTALAAYLLICAATAGGLHHAPGKAKAMDTFGPYYLGVSGSCDVFEVWYDTDAGLIYGTEVGCAAGKTGQAVIGTFDSSSFDIYVSAAGSQSAYIMDFDLTNMVLNVSTSDGISDSQSQMAITLGEDPITEDSGPSILQ